MPSAPEREPVPKQPEGIKEVPETPEVSPAVERAGVKTTPSQVTAQVTDDQGQQLIQTPANKTTTITIPTDQDQLSVWAKGPPASSLTWLGAFWTRMIKKAFHFGWKVVKKREEN